MHVPAEIYSCRFMMVLSFPFTPNPAQGTPVVGCAAAGLMGFDSTGRPFEMDPSNSESQNKGVSILLGHMPHAEIRVFADTPVR